MCVEALFTDLDTAWPISTPPLCSPARVVRALQARGHKAVLTQFSPRGLRTSASMAEIVRVAVEDLQVPVVGGQTKNDEP